MSANVAPNAEVVKPNTSGDEFQVEFDFINGFKAQSSLGLGSLILLVPIMVMGISFEEGFNQAIVLLIILLASLVGTPLITWLTLSKQKCRITSTEIQIQTGFINVRNKRVPIDQVLEVAINQSCIEKPFGVFTLGVETSAYTHVRNGRRLPEVLLIAPRNPEQVRDFIMKKRELLRTGINQNTIAISMPPTGADAVMPTEASQLREQLAKLEAEKQQHEIEQLRAQVSKLQAQQ